MFYKFLHVGILPINLQKNFVILNLLDRKRVNEVQIANWNANPQKKLKHSKWRWKLSDKAQCENYRILLSRFLNENFVKAVKVSFSLMNHTTVIKIDLTKCFQLRVKSKFFHTAWCNIFSTRWDLVVFLISVSLLLNLKNSLNPLFSRLDVLTNFPRKPTQYCH